MRFYVEGHEVDVADPTFFMDEQEYCELEETLDEMLDAYSKNIQVATPRKRPLLSNSGQQV